MIMLTFSTSRSGSFRRSLALSAVLGFVLAVASPASAGLLPEPGPCCGAELQAIVRSAPRTRTGRRLFIAFRFSHAEMPNKCDSER